jgi:hypothetical protein
MYKIIGSDQKQYGPVSADDLRQWVAEGRVNAQTLIQAEGQTDWRPLSSYPEFATVAAPAPSGIPTMAGAAPAAGNAAALVNGPGIALMIVGILCILASLWGVVSNLAGFNAAGQNAANLPPQFQQWMRLMTGPLGMGINVIALLFGAFFIFASTKMRKLESYGMVMTATILSMLPCTSSCCCIGLPLGIWILVVLAKPEVKSAFR